MENKQAPIWSLIQVKASQIKPNPRNVKKRNSEGFKKLQKSLEKFGEIFDGICNRDLSLIDGHSRLEIKMKNPNAICNVFVPDRQLTPKEETELNAIYDIAKAGETDFDIVLSNFGDAGIDADEWNFDSEM